MSDELKRIAELEAKARSYIDACILLDNSIDDESWGVFMDDMDKLPEEHYERVGGLAETANVALSDMLDSILGESWRDDPTIVTHEIRPAEEKRIKAYQTRVKELERRANRYREALQKMRDSAFEARNDPQTPRLHLVLKRIYAMSVKALEGSEGEE